MILAQCHICARSSKCYRIRVNQHIKDSIFKCTIEQLETGGSCYDYYPTTVHAMAKYLASGDKFFLRRRIISFYKEEIR